MKHHTQQINTVSGAFADYLPLQRRVQELKKMYPEMTSVEIANILDVKVGLVNKLWSPNSNERDNL